MFSTTGIQGFKHQDALPKHGVKESANEPGKIMFNQVLTTVYSANGLLAALVYLPQIRAIWNDASGAKSVSLLTWSVWATSSSVTLLYAWLVVHDRPMMVAAAVGTTGSLSVLAASLYRRRQVKP